MFIFFIHSCRAFNEPYYIGMIVPFLIIYLFNWVIFFIIIVSLVHKTFQPHVRDVRSKKDNICQQLIIAVTLSVLFGLGWGIGLFATQDIHTNKTMRDLFAALFVIITAFHGLFIFITQCLRSREVRNEWKRWFFGVTGKDISELGLSTFSIRNQKSGRGTIIGASLRGTSLHGCEKSTLKNNSGNVRTLQMNVEKESECLPSTIALDDMDISKEIEDNASVEISFTTYDEVDEKKKLQKEEEQYQS